MPKITNQQGEQLYYCQDIVENAQLSIVYFNGFHSQLWGEKSETVREIAKESHCNALFFDYQAHGQSTGNYLDSSFKDWLNDALLLIQDKTQGPLLLVGSSMGAWLATLVAEQIPDRMHSLLCISGAFDFANEVIEKRMNEQQRKELQEKGFFTAPTRYDDEDYLIHQRLMKEGEELRVLNRPIKVYCPTFFLHGNQDTDVPWQGSAKALEQIQSLKSQLILVKGSQHRFSEKHELKIIEEYLLKLIHGTA